MTTMANAKLNIILGVLMCGAMLLNVMPSHAQSSTITMKWANFNASTAPSQIYLNKVADAVKQRSGGQVKVDMFPGGSLVGGMQMLRATRNGLIDVGWIIPSFFPAEMPIGYWGFEVPFGPTWDNASAFLDEIRPIIEEECKANGIKLLVLQPLRHEWFFTKPINLAVPDWSGLKVRPLGGLIEEMAKHLGAGTVSMTSSETPIALSTKVIDGVATSIASYYHLGMYRSAPYVFVTDAMTAMVNIWGYNLDKWNKLPKDIQKIMSEEFSRLNKDWYLKYVKEEDIKSLKMAEEKGAIMMIPTAAQKKIWQKKMEATWNVIPQKTGAKGQMYLDIVKKHIER